MEDPTERSGSESVAEKETRPVDASLLRQYEQIKFELASLIRMASSYARGEADELRRDCRALQTKLAEDRFYLTVVGQSSRGKSTLINALLGIDRLPTGIVPITSVITSVGYGSKELVIVYSHGHSWGLDIPLIELPNYITEQGNPGNVKDVDIAEVQLPAEILQRGFYLIDTPGFGSAIFENTLTTRKFLPQADAFIFVTSFDAPFSADELQFFREAQSRGRKVFVVINKSDLVDASQRDEILRFVTQRLANECDVESSILFPLSAREGLTARLGHDAEKLAKSGLPVFEAALISFLTEEKTRQLLLQTCEALDNILFNQINPDMTTIRDRVRGLRARISGEGKIDAQESHESAASSGRTIQVRPCFICTATLDATSRFLSGHQYELWRNIDAQQDHAERGGFCPFHTWQYQAIASPQGVCSSYPTLLLAFANKLNALSKGGIELSEFKQSVRKIPSDSKRCKICEVAAGAEKRAVAKFISQIDSPPSDKTGVVWILCFSHLVRVLEEVADTEPGERLIREMSRALEYVAENMRRYALKHEGLRRELASEEEVHAAGVGITLLAGHPKILPRITR